MKKKLNTRSLYAVLGVILLGIVGVTFAYYSTNNTFTNEFNAGEYKIKTEEVFESPTNWKPGDVTPKIINVKNEGTVDAAVKVCFREKWEDENGNSLPLEDSNYKNYVTLHNNLLSSAYWKQDCDNDCYYYYKKLAPGETTKDLLDSVEFNSDASFLSSNDCTEDPSTHVKTCTSTLNGYSGGKYTLYIDIETVQYNAYQEAWGNVSVRNSENTFCENLSVRSMLPTRSNGTVGYYINIAFLKDSELVDYDLSEAKCDVVYINSVSDDNKYNRCVGVIYIDGTNHYYGERLNLKLFNILINDRIDSIETVLDDGSILLSDSHLSFQEYSSIAYDKLVIAKNFFEFNDNDVDVMDFSNIDKDYWLSLGKIYLPQISEYTMPNHSVLFYLDTSRK